MGTTLASESSQSDRAGTMPPVEVSVIIPCLNEENSLAFCVDKAVKAFRAKMQTDQAKQIYRTRAEVAEFPNAWIKEKLGLRKFRLRGLRKVGLEAIWACVTYNIQQWIRITWRPKFAAAAL